MSYSEIKGNLFASKAHALVNTVNCVGVMGKGIALEFRRRYPEIFRQYVQDCDNKEILPGKVYYYPFKNILILNFAVKDHWKYPSKLKWVESCLQQFRKEYKEKEISSVAFPWMGAMNGRIPLNIIKDVMRRYLFDLRGIQVEVYDFDPDARDPLWEILQELVNSHNASYLAAIAKITLRYCDRIFEAVRDLEVNNLYQLTNTKDIGKKSIDKLYSCLSRIYYGDIKITKEKRLF